MHYVIPTPISLTAHLRTCYSACQKEFPKRESEPYLQKFGRDAFHGVRDYFGLGGDLN